MSLIYDIALTQLMDMPTDIADSLAWSGKISLMINLRKEYSDEGTT